MNVEKEFSDVVRKLGGARVDELLQDPHLTKNADFAFVKEGTIAELKCLDTDVINSEAAIEKASRLYVDALEKNKITKILFGTAQLSGSDFPEEYSQRLKAIYREPLRRLLKDASSQIRETKGRLSMEHANGLVIIANNNHSALEPAHAHELLRELLDQVGWYSGINAAIYLTANMAVTHSPSGAHGGVWIEFRRGIPEIDQGLLKRLREEWYLHISNLSGRPPPQMGVVDTTQLSELQNSAKT